MKEALEKSLVDFQEFIHKICSLDIFHSLMLSILQISNKVKKENLSLQMRDWIDEMLAAAKLAKRLFSTDLSTFHKLLSKVISEMSDISEEPEEVTEKIKVLSTWVVGVHVDIENIKTDNKLVDYIKELEELKSKFSELAEVSKKVGDRNEELRKSEGEFGQMYAAEKKRADKAEKKLEKTTKTFEELKAKYGQLYEKFNQSLLEVKPADPEREHRRHFRLRRLARTREEKQREPRGSLVRLREGAVAVRGHAGRLPESSPR